MADPKEITIQGVLVKVSQPYEAGHQITEAEAKALNQVRAENIANNNRKTIKDMLEEAGGDASKVAKKAAEIVAAYDAEYEFTLASVGGGRTKLDSLTKEARSIARELVVGKIKESGQTLKEYEEKNGKDKFTAKVIEVSEMPEVVKMAKAKLKEREGLAEALSI